jgi:hypothetical protein
VLNKSPAFSLGNRSKSARQIDFDHNTFKPGPTAYNKDGAKRSKAAFIGSSHRKELTET